MALMTSRPPPPLSVSSIVTIPKLVVCVLITAWVGDVAVAAARAGEGQGGDGDEHTNGLRAKLWRRHCVGRGRGGSLTDAECEACDSA